MKVIILAAGYATRLYPLTLTQPKPLLPVAGRPLVVWLIEKLVSAGIIEIVINISHLGDRVEAVLGDGVRHGARIVYSREEEALETAGGVAHALPLLGAAPFLAVNGDVFSAYDFGRLRAVAERMANGDTLAHLVLVDNPEHHPAGDFCLRGGLVHAGERGRLTFSGIGVYRPALFASIAPGAKHPLAALLREPIAQGRVSGEHYRDLWVDVGTPDRLARLDRMLAASG
ncbi:MAG: nucleotidyltransferase family protein [Burkholderiales bacterium]|nr:nucleotidyltransferase family protein [Burkholderiales bacterium]